jgi:hypothetical protein
MLRPHTKVGIFMVTYIETDNINEKDNFELR